MSTKKPTPLSDKYFREKATEFVFRVVGYKSLNHIQDLYLLLKEVNKDTRHACAEVRVECPDVQDDYTLASIPDFVDGFIRGQEAHADACMNVQEESYESI